MQDFESLSHYRLDGRKTNEIRNLEFEVGLKSFKNFNGSAKIKQGVSEVLCFIDGPNPVL